MATEAEVRDWLTEFAACVRTEDYERGRKLFAPGVYAFGTVAEAASGLDQLVANQWQSLMPLMNNDFNYRLLPSNHMMS